MSWLNLIMVIDVLILTKYCKKFVNLSECYLNLISVSMHFFVSATLGANLLKIRSYSVV
jgi:hypothetical protein